MTSVMDTSPENTLSSFDLDLLLSSASSSIYQNSENINNGYQIHSMGNTSTANLGYQAHNMENLKTTEYTLQNQVQNLENELYKPEHIDHDVVKKSEYEALQKDYKVKCDDYEAVKKQYARIASDYANLHDENKKHALEALNVSTRNEQLEKQVTSYMKQITSLREQIEKMYTHNFAQNNSMAQFQSYVAELQAQNATLVNDLKSEKLNGKDACKMISTLNNSNQTLTEHLCLLGCIIEERRPIEKETRRLIKKYCKKCITSNKKNVEVENFSNHSFDTGRGSSLSCSDGERSFYSPAFSLNFSPLSTGTLITKASMRDAASSPPPVTKTLDISTSPLIFEEVITIPFVKTSDSATSPILRYEAGTPEAKAKLLHVATSPVKFSDSITPNTIDVASSPIMFDDTNRPVFKTNIFDIVTSPIKYADTSMPVLKTKSLDVATSPVKFADTSIPVVKSRSLGISTRPVQFSDTSTQVPKQKTIDTGTSPVKFADTRTPVVQMKSLDIATTPVKIADTNTPVVKSRSLGISTSPVPFSDTSTQVPKERTIDTGTSPVMFTDTSTPVVQTKSLDIATTLVKIADTNTIDTCTSPVKFAPAPPEAKAKTFTLKASRPAQVSGKIHPEDNKKTSITTRLENTKTALAKKYKLDMTLPKPCADSSTLVPKATTEILPVSNAQPDTDTDESNSTCHLNEIKQTLNEIESLHLEQEDSENDLEIKMILRKQSLDWDMLSPMSLTPELDPENEQKQKDENTKVNQQCLNMKQTEMRNLIQSLHISGNEDSDAEIDREDNNFDRIVIESLQHLVNNEDDLVKNVKMVENDESNNLNSNSRIEEVKLPKESLNKNHTKYKKLTNLQKIYKANIPKSKIKSPLPLGTKQGLKPYSISPKKHLASLIPNKGVQKLPEQNACQKQDTNSEVSTETVKCTFKKPQPLPEFFPKRSTELRTNSECTPLTQTNLQHETVPKKGERMSTEKQITSNSLHHTKPNVLLESALKTGEFASTDIQSNNNLPHMQTDLQPKTVCMPTVNQAKSISDLHTQTYVPPESGRRKTLCTPNPQLNCKNEINPQTTIVPESSPSVQNKSTELINEHEISQCYSKPSSKRISRVGKSISTNAPVLPNQVDDNTNKRRICASDTMNDNSHNLIEPSYKKDKANHDMVISPVLEEEQTRLISSTEEAKEKSTNNNKIAVISVSNKDHSKRSQKTDNISVTLDTMRPDERNICSISKTKSAPLARQFADYNGMSLFTNSDLHTQTYVPPESGRRKTLCTSNPQSNCKNETNPQKTIGPESSPSVQNKPTELINEYEISQCYPKPSSKRISRVGKSISTKAPVLPNQVDDNTNKRRICASDTITDNSHSLTEPSYKKNKANHDMVISPVLEEKQTRLISSTEEDKEKSTNNNKIAVSVSNKDHSKRSQKTDNISVTLDTMRPDERNICSISKTKSAPPARQFADYNDMSLFTNTDEIITSEEPKNEVNDNKTQERDHNLLDKMLTKYGSNRKPQKRPIYDAVVAEKIETGVNKCVEISEKPDEYDKAIQELVNELKKLGSKKITFGWMMYLNNPARKAQFVPEKKPLGHRQRNAMTITKPEMAIIEIIELLEKSGINLWDVILDSCEYILFSLEKGATPVFDVIESVAHLFANICKYRGNVSRLWMFMLNAMYCLSFKAIPVIKHCLDVVPRVLPLSHTYVDPVYTPMIRCLVFLLHYYNCDDPFKRVQELRQRLKDKYFYNLQDENETTILFLLKNSIINLSERKLERDILELTFLVMAKRQGTKWCHKNIVQKILLPMIKGEIDVSYRGKRFCITTIGQILKPYKNEMTVHSEEVVNLLTSMFEQSQPHEIKEDIVCGLISMNMKTISERINKCLFNWNPPHLSPEFEEALKDYIQSKNISTWQVVYQNIYKERFA